MQNEFEKTHEFKEFIEKIKEYQSNNKTFEERRQYKNALINCFNGIIEKECSFVNFCYKCDKIDNIQKCEKCEVDYCKDCLVDNMFCKKCIIKLDKCKKCKTYFEDYNEKDNKCNYCPRKFCDWCHNKSGGDGYICCEKCSIEIKNVCTNIFYSDIVKIILNMLFID